MSRSSWLLGQSRVTKHRPQWWWRNKIWVVAWFRNKVQLGGGRKSLGDTFLPSNGSKTLELSKGKPSVQCESLQEVKKVLETVFAAADKGELDSLLMSAGTELRKRFRT